MNINNLFSNKPVFVAICSKLDNKSLLSFLGTQKSFNEFGKTNKQINEIICNNLGVFDLPKGIESWQKMKEITVTVVQGKLVLEEPCKVGDLESVTAAPSKFIPIFNWFNGDNTIPKHYEVYNDGEDTFYGSCLEFGNSHRIAHYQDNKEAGWLKCEMKNRRICGLIFFMDKLFNKVISLEKMPTEDLGIKDLCCIWDLNKYQLLQTIDINIPVSESDVLTAISSEGTRLFFWFNDHTEDKKMCFSSDFSFCDFFKKMN